MLPARLPCVAKHKKRNVKGVLLFNGNFMLNTEQLSLFTIVLLILYFNISMSFLLVPCLVKIKIMIEVCCVSYINIMSNAGTLSGFTCNICTDIDVLDIII